MYANQLNERQPLELAVRKSMIVATGAKVSEEKKNDYHACIQIVLKKIQILQQDVMTIQTVQYATLQE